MPSSDCTRERRQDQLELCLDLLHACDPRAAFVRAAELIQEELRGTAIAIIAPDWSQGRVRAAAGESAAHLVELLLGLAKDTQAQT